MLYISKGQHGHPIWIGLIELVEVIQAASECNEEEAHAQIKAALADSAIWPLDWEPVPVPSAYCESRLGPSAPIFGKPVRPPPPSSKSLDDFTDRRSVSHWRAIKIDWEQGRVLDDFEREAYPRLNEQAVNLISRPGHFPQPRTPEWRTLFLDREACERIWRSASNVSKAGIVEDDGPTKSTRRDQPASFRPGHSDEQWSPPDAPISGALLTGAIQSPEPEEMPASATAKTTETENVDVAPPEPVHTIARETECQVWLVKLMRNGSSPDKRKLEYRDEALKLYETSARAFIRAWKSAITKTGNKNWSRAGRKSGSRSHEKS